MLHRPRVLDYLHVQSLALLDDVTVEFDPRMNVLTGETGAGKSLIIDALSLLRGGRAQVEVVRDGADAAKIVAQFVVGDSVGRIAAALGDAGIETGEDENLVIERVVSRTGRSRSRLQAQLTTQTVLRSVGERLVDICSQHEHHSLTHVSRHIELLDAFAGIEAQVGNYAQTYAEWVAATRAVREVEEQAAARLQRMDYLRFQLEELDRVDVQAGEYDDLRRRVDLLRDARTWIAFAREAREMLYEADDAIASRLAGLSERATKGADDSPLLAEMGGQLESAQIACEEAAAAASRFAAQFEVDSDDLEALEERLHELDHLRRKHGCEVDELPGKRDAMQTALVELETAEDRASVLEARRKQLEAQCRELAAELSTGRAQAADDFARAVEERLAALHMPKARVEAGLAVGDKLGPRGLDHVEFMFSANEGESLAPLSKVASGGELSRVLLALKGVLATGDRVATYVFDEVDSGVGGAVAESIGRELWRAATDRQVLCVTHLPQIAAFAQAHFRVEKASHGGRTRTKVVRLNDTERVEELARMLAGSRVTARAREHAAELLAQAQAKPRSRHRGRRSATGASRPKTVRSVS
ncbi:MAG: DNA repair protein RecN [Myxococcales bacterium FL481]|nr:MAG: DNA repair protein RecN [Myxococcales bacterium FL481]